ncbi:beta-lactamase-like protein [Apodospora peruviana]|uniref:Beta-lactamase-like protein n=1 Tax=Apodospora peruviana TaxID=516989 RepID=A0AAE0HZ34_9PEZI|nr:beta-lactamase-like protein [Apodospora peruviana]
MASRKAGFPQINISPFEDYIAGKKAILPELKDVEQLSPRVIRILGQNPGKMTMQGTNTYIVGTGPKRLIIDTGQGMPAWADLVSSTLAMSSASLSHVLLTHWHGDHVGGVPDLVRRYPHLLQGESGGGDGGPMIYKHSPRDLQQEQPIADGQVFCVEGATIRAVHSPGHSHDHMCFVLEEEGAMFTGDNVLGHGTGFYEHLGTWMATLRAMRAHDCRVGYPAHGVVIADLPSKIAGELAQKERRERHVLQTLLGQTSRRKNGKGGGLTVGELVVEMHGSALAGSQTTATTTHESESALVPFFEETLRKLAEDGKVGFGVRRGQKSWFALETTIIT